MPGWYEYLETQVLGVFLTVGYGRSTFAKGKIGDRHASHTTPNSNTHVLS